MGFTFVSGNRQVLYVAVGEVVTNLDQSFYWNLLSGDRQKTVLLHSGKSLLPFSTVDSVCSLSHETVPLPNPTSSPYGNIVMLGHTISSFAFRGIIVHS